MALGVGLAAAPTAVAGAQVGCSVSVRNADTGYAKINRTHTLRTGPYSTCTKDAVVLNGEKFWLWCWVVNDHGNRWAYGRIDGTNHVGWTSIENFGYYETNKWPSC
ncbi:hypothetical protein ACFYVL_42645 [Streptomyces sp. NPDC004111]|uniref:hypothetical protein n=1 Tax=Streptomyces sp. NPDC004111 TaxID=3364690 RepID=UPI00368E7530